MILMLSSCCNSNKCRFNKIELSSSFKSKINCVEYCSLLDRAIKGDSLAFNNLLEYPIDNGLIIDHSVVVCQLIKIIGKERVCNWVQDSVIDIKDVNRILSFGAHHSFDKKELQYYLDESYEFNCSGNS